MAGETELSVEAVERRLFEFFKTDLEWEGDFAELVGDDPVRLPSVVDSEELLEIVTFLEEEYEIEIEDDEINPEHFQTASDVARLIVGKVVAAA